MIDLSTLKKTKIQKSSESIIIYIIITASLTLMTIFPKYVSSGIKSGIDCCLNTLVPSMFPFMIISSMLLSFKTKQNQKSLLSKIIEFLFYLPGYTLPVIAVSLIGGYPIGAYCAKHLYKDKQINKEQLNRIMTFCVNSGPAFIVSVLGETLLKSPKTGLKLLLIQIISSLLIGILYGITARMKKLPFRYSTINTQDRSITFSSLLIDSCNSTCHSLINMCSLVTLFFGVTSALEKLNIAHCLCDILQKINIPPYLSHIFIISTLEMTQGCIVAAKNLYSPYWLYSWIIGFGGICAHTQIIAELKNCPFQYKKFLIARILNGILTALITTATIKNQDLAIQTASNLRATAGVSTSAPTYFGSITLLLFCILFTFNFNSPFNKDFKSR